MYSTLGSSNAECRVEKVAHLRKCKLKDPSANPDTSTHVNSYACSKPHTQWESLSQGGRKGHLGLTFDKYTRVRTHTHAHTYTHGRMQERTHYNHRKSGLSAQCIWNQRKVGTATGLYYLFVFFSPSMAKQISWFISYSWKVEVLPRQVWFDAADGVK